MKIEALDHQGRGIAKYENKVYFIENALPEEDVEIEIKKQKKNIVEAKVIKYNKKNNELRDEPLCPYYGICGGCDIMHIKNQNQYKLDKLNNIINKYVDNSIKINEVEELDDLNYRNKITLQVKNNKLGLYKKESNEIVEIDKCYLVKNKINEIIRIIKENQDLKYINQIIIKDMKETMITFKTNNNINIDYLKKYVDSIYINDKLVYGKNKIVEQMDKYNFLISSDSFFQVNTKMATKMYNYIDSLIEKTDIIFDLYCGTGTIGIFVHNKANKVIGLEINEESIKDANENKKINNITNIEFYASDSANIKEKTNLKPNVIIVDPPRSGLSDKMVKDIISLNPQTLIYVSCDPMTLARDIKKLDSYEVISIKGFNMFPNTYHVEVVCYISKINK